MPKVVYRCVANNLFFGMHFQFERRSSIVLRNRVVTASEGKTDIASFSAFAFLQLLNLSFFMDNCICGPYRHAGRVFFSRLNEQTAFSKIKRTQWNFSLITITVKELMEEFQELPQLLYCPINLVGRSWPVTSFVVLVLLYQCTNLSSHGKQCSLVDGELRVLEIYNDP